MRILTIFFLLILPFAGLAKPAQIVNLETVKSASHNLRLVFTMSASITHNVFSLTSPHRLVIDLKNTKLGKKLRLPDSSLIKKIRSAPRHGKDLRIVLDLNVPVRSKSFFLQPGAGNDHRLVVDINPLKPIANHQYPKVKSTFRKVSPRPVVTKYWRPLQLNKRKRDIIIAIDPGHGGVDSGAIGMDGTQEKDVALSIAKELAVLIAKQPRMRVILIRNGDYFVKLRKRIDLARQYQADLFISIHADAYPDNKNVQGSSVYMLSRNGASSEAAKWLAVKENTADLIGGISLSDKDDLLASVLFDLSQAGTLKASALMGQKILKSLRVIGKNHYDKVQRAGFMVLRSPDVPSILVETGFISNPLEEQKLKLLHYRRRIATAIMKGIRAYFAGHVPAGAQLVQR